MYLEPWELEDKQEEKEWLKEENHIMEIKLTWEFYDILVSIYLANLKKNVTTKQIAKACGKSPKSSYIIATKKLLINEGILLHVNTIGSTDFFNLDRVKLDNLIRKSNQFERTGKFIMKSKPLDYNF